MKNKEISLEKFERIEAFLLNKMLEKERLEFEKELSVNNKLRKEVDVQRDLMLAVDTGEMKNRLETIHQKTSRNSNNIKWYLAAASVVILISIGLWTLNKPDKAERLFADNITIDPGLPVPMSATSNYTFYDAMVDYKSGKYELAIGKWKPLLMENFDNDTLNYYTGCALFNDEKYVQALPYFEQVSEFNQSAFYGKSEWYMALSYLKLKQFDHLDKLAQKSQSAYSEQIKQLNKNLE